MKKYIGTIVNTKGFKGEMTVDDILEDNIYLEEGTKVQIGYSLNFSTPMTVKTFKIKGKKGVLNLNGINDNIQGKKLKEMGIFVDPEDIKIKEKEILMDELLGYEVIALNEGNRNIGKVKEVWHLPANDVILVGTENGDNPIPHTDEIVKMIDKEQEKIFIEVIPGLLDLVSEDDNNE